MPVTTFVMAVKEILVSNQKKLCTCVVFLYVCEYVCLCMRLLHYAASVGAALGWVGSSLLSLVNELLSCGRFVDWLVP